MEPLNFYSSTSVVSITLPIYMWQNGELVFMRDRIATVNVIVSNN